MPTSLGQTAYSYDIAAGNSVTASFSTDPAAGSTILVGSGHFVWADGNDIVSSVTDNASNTYTLVPNTRQYNNGQNLEIWRAYNVSTTTGLIVTVTYLNPNMSQRRVHAIEVTGAETASDPIELSSGSVQDGPGTATDAVTTGPLGTPSTNGQFVFGMSIYGYNPDNVFAGTGFTAIGSFDYAGSNRAEYLIQGTASPVAATFTNDLAGGTWATAAVTVKAASGGGGGGGSPIGNPAIINSPAGRPATFRPIGNRPFTFVS